MTWAEALDTAGALSQPGSQLIVGATEGGPGLVAVGSDGGVDGVKAAVWTSP